MIYTIWMTGLPCSGKSTIADAVKESRTDIIILDGDVVRKYLCSDLGFSDVDRNENLRRIRSICKLLNDNGCSVIAAFISPLREHRTRAKTEIENCHVVYCKSDLKTCEERDVKGLYEKARAGQIKQFTGVSAPYEEPANPDLVLDTKNETPEQSVNKLICYLEKKERT